VINSGEESQRGDTFKSSEDIKDNGINHVHKILMELTCMLF